MAGKFDPYYTWLGIPPEDQPPDHYALLGVRQFESNSDVISNLTDQRMAHVKTFQAGPHGADSQKLLNEIAAARVCLLNPKKRKAYDAKLHAEIAWKTAPEAQPLPVEPEIVELQPIAAPPVAQPPSAAQSDSVSDAFAFIAATGRPVAAGGNLAVNKAVQSRARQQARARWLFIAAPILGIAAVVAAIMIRNSRDADDADPTPAPKGTSTALASGGEKPGSAHGSSSSGKPPAAKPQTEAASVSAGERPNDSNASARQKAIIPPKPDDPTAVAGNTKPSSNSPQNLPADNGSAKPAPAPAAPSVEQFPLGQWVDVLRFIDTNSKMVVEGNWSRDGQEISVQPGGCSRIAIPVAIKGSYDFKVEFTRASGNEGVTTMLSVASHPCEVVLGGWEGRAGGLEVINGYEAIDTRNPVAVRPSYLENGHRYRLLVNVQIGSGSHASVDVWLDGKGYLPRWSGDPATLAAHPRSPLPNASDLGLGAWQSALTFHSAQLKMLSGSASLDPALVSVNPPPAPAGAGTEPNLPVPHSDGSTAGESWAARANALIQSGRSAAAKSDAAKSDAAKSDAAKSDAAKSDAAAPTGPLLGKTVVEHVKIGVVITADTGPCRGIVATAP
ncbi:MAG TPA: hypothetical protein VHY91_24115, partial [Pirellulales bacterium]|nr:hypothetical protein [Pirellulales bacterium]